LTVKTTGLFSDSPEWIMRIAHMKKRTKTALSILLCIIMVFGIMGSTSMALNAEDYKSIPYHCYTYLIFELNFYNGTLMVPTTVINIILHIFYARL
jgi:hypothetical protein